MTLLAPPLDAADNSGSNSLLTDLTSDTPDFGWYVVNDNVMGGRSEGAFEQEQGKLHFSGNTNTNGGGFSSIRTASMQLDLSGHSGIRLHVMGDGRRYSWRLTTTARWRGNPVGYWADFQTRDGAWTTVDIPFSAFVPKYRGTELDGPALDTAQITGMGLMIYDKQDGPFDLQLASVRAYSDQTPFTLAQYQWESRVLVVSAARSDDQNLSAQRDDLAAKADAFADRDMVLVTLLDVGVSAADSHELTSAEVKATRKALGIRPGTFALALIGKDGTVKLSRDKATPMTEIFALIDTMPMRQREQLGPE